MSSTATQPRPIRAAVIGTGVISEAHLKYLSNDPLVDLVGVCDLSPSMGQYAIDRFKAKAAFTDAATMYREAQPEVVHVLTPPHTHVPIVTAALDAGLHVICEKPIAPKRAEFLQLWAHAQSKGKRLVEDHNYRFNAPILAIEKLVNEGQLGTVRDVEVRMSLPIRSPGRFTDTAWPHPSHNLPAGVLHEFISHLCYLALRFLPPVDMFDRVAAAWTKHGDEPLFKVDDLDAIVIAGGAHARIRFSSFTAPDVFSVTVRGEKGWAETDLFNPFLRVTIPRKGGKQLSPLMNHFVNGFDMATSAFSGFQNKIMQRGPLEGLRTFLGRTYDALRNDREPPVTFDDMDRASRLIDALLDEGNRL
jgi:predicted dehydrogenase